MLLLRELIWAQEKALHLQRQCTVQEGGSLPWASDTKRHFVGGLPLCWAWRLQKRHEFGIFYWCNEPCWRIPAAMTLVVAVTGAEKTSPEHRGQ